MNRPFIRWSSLFLLGGIMTLLAACAGPQAVRFQEGRALSDGGHYEAAANYYLEALSVNPEDELAQRLFFEAGMTVILSRLAEADAAVVAMNYSEAAQKYHQVDALHALGLRSGVSLSLPEDYAVKRRHVLDLNIETLLSNASDFARQRDYENALAVYDRLERDIGPNSDRLEELRQARIQAYRSWAENHFEEEEFRSAWERTIQLEQLAANDESISEEAERLREFAIDAGTRYVAVLPIWATAPSGAPADLLQEIYQSFYLNEATKPPLFVHVVDEVAIRREMRRLHSERDYITAEEAVEIARAISADVITMVLVEEFEDSQNAPLSQSGSVAIAERHVFLRLTVRLLDPHDQRVLDETELTIRQIGDAYEMGGPHWVEAGTIEGPESPSAVTSQTPEFTRLVSRHLANAIFQRVTADLK